jgi:phospholipid/cholesterol/gamma-HCH transport system substrate-binding protein
VTASRAVALGALVVVVAVVLVVVLGGGGDRTYKLRLENAGQLVKDNDVQIGGRRIGRVASIRLTDDNQAEVRIQVREPYAPLHEGTTAAVRSTSLSGVANRYIALTPGPNSAPELGDGAVLKTDKTTTPVDLDELFNTLDPKTRRALQNVVQGSATQLDGVGTQANEALKYFSPALSTTSKLAAELTRDQKTFSDFIVLTARTTTALAAKRDHLAGLVGNANRTAEAIGSESASLNQALSRLPSALRTGTTTFASLRSTLNDLDDLVDASKPVAPKLAPFFRQLKPLLDDAQPTIDDLSAIVSAPGADNDLTDLLRNQPKLTGIATSTFSSASQALRQSTPVVKYGRPYTPELIGWFRDFGETAANYDANGHFARVAPIFGAFKVNDTPSGPTLTALPPSERTVGLETGKYKRCPGSASQPADDGSSPLTSESDGCDPTAVVPGP